MLFSDSILLILRFLAVVELHCGPDTVNARLQFKAGGDRSGRTDDDAKLVQNKLVMFAERTRLHSLAPPRLHQKLRAGLGSLCFYFAFCACVHGQVMFDDSLPDRLRIATAAYEVAFSKANGAILSLADKAAVRPAPISSRNGCLWGSNYSGSSTTYRGGCNFGSGRPDSFQSEWNPALSLLTLKYNSAPVTVHRIDAEVAIVFQKDWFDMRLILRNQTGTIMQSVLFPSDLLLLASSVEAAYFPYYLPGARLLPGFFTGNRSITAIYPSARAFADYLAIDYGGGRLAWYAINTSARVAPVTLGFQDDVKTNPGSCYAVHNYSAWTPDGGRFETPVVRVQIGASPQESIRQYRNENGITDFPNLAAKLGNRSAAFASAPLVKLDLRIIGSTFAALSSRLDLIRPPAILHPVSYWPRGFDQNYPDFLPLRRAGAWHSPTTVL